MTPAERDQWVDRAREAVDAWLRPVGLSAFEERHLGRAPLHLRATSPAARFGLPTPDELVAAITTQPMRPGDIVLARGGEFLPAQSLLDRAGRVDASALYDALRSGITVSVCRLHHRLPGVRRAQAALGAALGLPINGSNCYLTPKGAQGLPLHTDGHDVLALQVSGTKIWRVHERLVDDPTPEQKSAVDRAPFMFEAKLAPGDVLYLPCGFPHAATAQSDAASFHVTFGITRVTWGDLILRVLGKADAAWASAGTADLAALRAKVAVTLREAFASGAVDAARAQARAEIVGASARQLAELDQARSALATALESGA